MQKKNKRAWSAHNKPLSLKHSIGNKHDRNQEEGRTQESRHQGQWRQEEALGLHALRQGDAPESYRGETRSYLRRGRQGARRTLACPLGGAEGRVQELEISLLTATPLTSLSV
ncbi:hypothetical protein ACHAXA_004653 [Cyclostephanos tholiformis]|uniref:Uncharacterized protein n=1 Tax=Cyclostephanos tholiformis TaxID=382380 RepID=A0ABD3R827_9STRA